MFYDLCRFFFFFKQKTAYELRISDWSSDVCSSDLVNFTARIRGIGTVGENPGLESSVGLFIDGVYRSRTGVGLSELGDIERVEVLRGPQGTLFGRNSTAGLINIVTKGPELGAFAGKGSLSYGNYDYWRVDGMINAPLSAKIGRAQV